MLSGGSRLLRCMVLIVVLGVAAAPASASAKHLSRKQRAKIVQQLRRQVRHNGRVVLRKSFLRRASLVNFRLPVTLVLRTGDDPSTPNVDESTTRNTNRASIDLGTTLGQREVDLGGRLAAVIEFADSYDGGALGNVKIELQPSASKVLETTSIPLVWNDQVWTNSTTRWDANAVNDLINSGRQVTLPGCGDFDSSTTDPTKAIAGNLLFARGYEPVAGGPGLPGFPLNQANDGTSTAPGAQNFDPNNTNIPEGFLPQQSGIDTPTRLQATRNPGDPMALGGNPTPFPTVSSDTAPGGFAQPPSVADTVLRTAPLALQVAPAGTEVNMTGDPSQGGTQDGVNRSQNVVIGKSGGEANLFGRIPGKPYGIDVTASFATRISSIIRIIDQDLTGRNLIEGEPWPAGVFGCRQVYTGFVDNYLPGVHLRGTLHIAPAITSDGHLRIAKAIVSSTTPTRFPVAACVVPMSSFQKPNDAPGENRSDAPAGSYTEYDDNLPSPFSAGVVLQPLDPILFPQYTGGMEPLSELPVDTNAARDRPPARPCNTPGDRIVQESAMQPATVKTLAPGLPEDGYSTSPSGAAISIAADLTVNQVSLDVIIGDQPAPPSTAPSGGLRILGGILDPILSLLPPVFIPPIIPSLPSVPAPPPVTTTTTTATTPSVTTTVPSTTVGDVTTPPVTATVPSVTTTIPIVTTTLPTETTPTVTTTVPSTTVGDITTPSETTTIPSVTTTLPTVTTTPTITATVPSTTIGGITTPTVTTTVPIVTVPLLTTATPKAALATRTLDPSSSLRSSTTSTTSATPMVRVESEPSVFETPLSDPIASLLQA